MAVPGVFQMSWFRGLSTLGQVTVCAEVIVPSCLRNGVSIYCFFIQSRRRDCLVGLPTISGISTRLLRVCRG